MSDTWWKLHVLKKMLVSTFYGWREHIWETDPDQRACCRGDPMMDECGCQGVTIREVYDSAYE